MSEELLNTISVVPGEVTTAEPDVDQVYPIDMDHSEQMGASLRACVCISRFVT